MTICSPGLPRRRVRRLLRLDLPHRRHRRPRALGRGARGLRGRPADPDHEALRGAAGPTTRSSRLIRANTRAARHGAWATSTPRSRAAPWAASGSSSSWTSSASSGSSRWPTRSSAARSAPCAQAIRALQPGRLHGTRSPPTASTSPSPSACRCEVRGDELLVDYAGSSPASRRGVNVVMNYTEAYTTYGVKVIVEPRRAATTRARSARCASPAPAGSHPERAAPGAGGRPAHRRPLPAPRRSRARSARRCPDRVMAEGSANIWGITALGAGPARATRSCTFFSIGRHRARAASRTGCRPPRSLPASLGTPVGGHREPRAAARSRRKALREDSGGAREVSWRARTDHLVSARTDARSPSPSS